MRLVVAHNTPATGEVEVAEVELVSPGEVEESNTLFFDTLAVVLSLGGLGFG